MSLRAFHEVSRAPRLVLGIQATPYAQTAMSMSNPAIEKLYKRFIHEQDVERSNNTEEPIDPGFPSHTLQEAGHLLEEHTTTSLNSSLGKQSAKLRKICPPHLPHVGCGIIAIQIVAIYPVVNCDDATRYSKSVGVLKDHGEDSAYSDWVSSFVAAMPSAIATLSPSRLNVIPTTLIILNLSIMEAKKLRVGVIGAGEVAQVIHLPVLALMPHLYTVVIVCDVSAKTAAHCAEKYHIPASTTNVDDVVNHPDVDVVFVLTSDEYHEKYTIQALDSGKHVMLEKPITLSLPSARRIIAAEQRAGGPRVFVGYMRRYAPSFLAAFKREMASIPKILYARSRDFSGPNASFVAQSGTFPVKNFDFESSDERTQLLHGLLSEAFDGRELTPERVKLCRFLGSLGSHDISLLREALGVPESVSGVAVNDPFYTAIFNYRNKTGEPFAVTYESGIDMVPSFDAHLAVYGEKKRVWIEYDSPYVKGLPITVKVEEVNDAGEIQRREVMSSYEDAYTVELQDMYACLVEGKPIKTTLEDAENELKIFDMMIKRWEESK